MSRRQTERRASERLANRLSASLHFDDSSGLEPVYLVYTSEKNRGLTMRMHGMMISAWSVGLLKPLAQALYVARTGTLNPPNGGLQLRYAFLLVAQLANLIAHMSATRVLRSVNREDQLQQERVKAWLHVLMDVAVMVCVILSDPSLPHAPWPVSAVAITSLLAVLDMLRFSTLLRLHSVKLMCFAFLELDMLWRSPHASVSRVLRDVGLASLFGAIIPLALAARMEASQREAFLKDCHKPATLLPRFWQQTLDVVRRLPFGRGVQEVEHHPHTD